MNASELQAGRELDARVAEKVMGARWLPSSDPAYEILRFHPTDNTIAVRHRETGAIEWGEAWEDEDDAPFRYSTDIAAAWKVFTAPPLLEAGWLPFIESGFTRAGVSWEVGFGHHDLDAMIEYVRTPEEIPAAICRQALAALEVPR